MVAPYTSSVELQKLKCVVCEWIDPSLDDASFATSTIGASFHQASINGHNDLVLCQPDDLKDLQDSTHTNWPQLLPSTTNCHVKLRRHLTHGLSNQLCMITTLYVCTSPRRWLFCGPLLKLLNRLNCHNGVRTSSLAWMTTRNSVTKSFGKSGNRKPSILFKHMD